MLSTTPTDLYSVDKMALHFLNLLFQEEIMRPTGKAVIMVLSLCCVSIFTVTYAADEPHSVSSTQERVANADNSGINTRDKQGATLTPQDQENQVEDRRVLAAVRRAVVRDKALSSSAHNVKIVVMGGAVTLRGPVNSSDEKSKLGKIAQQIAGVTSVDNQLDVKNN